jgi:hypothetical protein
MGASGWAYVVPFQDDLDVALTALRRQVFAEGAYLKPGYWGDVFDLPEPASLEELTGNEQYAEFMGTSGTHSIIDVDRVVPADFDGEDCEEYGTIRMLSEQECAGAFGTTRPSHTDYDAPAKNLHDLVEERWTGRAVVLWADSKPTEIAFWGYSGDLPNAM